MPDPQAPATGERDALVEQVRQLVSERHYGAMDLTPDEAEKADDLVRAWCEQVIDALGLEQVGWWDDRRGNRYGFEPKLFNDEQPMDSRCSVPVFRLASVSARGDG